MMAKLQKSQNELLGELRSQKDRHRKLVERLQGDITEVEKIKGKRVLMVNDGNIALPIYDYLHYNKIFEDLDRQKRMEMLHLLNRYGESIVASLDQQQKDYLVNFYGHRHDYPRFAAAEPRQMTAPQIRPFQSAHHLPPLRHANPYVHPHAVPARYGGQHLGAGNYAPAEYQPASQLYPY